MIIMDGVRVMAYEYIKKENNVIVVGTLFLLVGIIVQKIGCR